MKVLRLYHAGRDPGHRERDRALHAAGVEVALVIPTYWPGADVVHDEPFSLHELEVSRPGDVNRHRYADARALARLIDDVGPDVLDVHEEPFSALLHQVLDRVPTDLAVVGYTAQNIDKRFPPPFAGWERRALARLDGLYPCSRQAAAVSVGKGYTGPVEVLPLPPAAAIAPGGQALPAEPVRLLLVGRLVAEKGVFDAVRAAASVADGRVVQLRLVGDGPAAEAAETLARELGVQLVRRGWLDTGALAAEYAAAHVLLAPSRASATWAEQFGRMAAEAQAAGAVVIGYASGALPEVVGAAGVLVPPGDVDALAAAVDGVLREPARWAALRADGFALAGTRTWPDVAARMVRLYERASAPRAHLGVRPHRRAAREAFGVPAATPTGERPFALPVLRDHPRLARPAAALTDRVTRRDRAVPARELRVVFLDHVARMSGGEIALLRLLSERPGYRAHVILGEDGPLVAALEQVGVEVEVLQLDAETRDRRRTELTAFRGLAPFAGYARRLAARLRELEPDLVHSNSLKSGYYGSLAARRAGVPLVWHLRDRIAPDYLPASLVRVTRAVLATMPDLVIANSQATALTAGRRPSVVALPDPYAPTRPPRTEHGPLCTLGVVGRLTPWKGQDVALRALAELRAHGLRLALRVVGGDLFDEPEYGARLRALAAELGVADQVVFTGHIDDIEAELARLDVLLHTSRVPEPFGQVVLEGMAAGLPVIATDSGGPRELITPGADGRLVPPDDPAALAAAIGSLADPQRRAGLGQAAAARAAAFDPAAIGARLRSLYGEVVAHR